MIAIVLVGGKGSLVKAGTGPINAGVYLLRNELLNDIISQKEVSLEYDCFPRWLTQQKNIEVIAEGAPFIDIGTPESLKRAQEMIQKYQAMIMGYKEILVA